MNLWSHESESLHRDGEDEYFCKMRHLNLSPKEIGFGNVVNIFNLIKLIMIFLHLQIQSPMTIFDKMLPLLTRKNDEKENA